MRLVRQESPNGCGIAALAMVTGKTYGEVLDDLVTGYPTSERIAAHALHDGMVEWYLACQGYVWRRLYAGWALDRWPPAPFAPLHIVQVVQPSTNTHYVVWLPDETVLDPLSDEPTTLARWSGQKPGPRINNVLGIWREPEQSDEQAAVPD